MKLDMARQVISFSLMQFFSCHQTPVSGIGFPIVTSPRDPPSISHLIVSWEQCGGYVLLQMVTVALVVIRFAKGPLTSLAPGGHLVCSSRIPDTRVLCRYA